MVQVSNYTPASKPALIKKLVLNTPCSQRIFNRTFKEVSRNAFKISIVAPHRNQTEQGSAVIDKANQEVKVIFSDMIVCLQREEQRLIEMGVDAEVFGKLSYSAPLEIDALITTPLADIFLQVIQQWDRINQLLDGLWLAGVLDHRQKLRGEYEWQRRIIKISNNLRNITNTLPKAARRANDNSGSGEAE